jgi:signal transduction histidine kinase
MNIQNKKNSIKIVDTKSKEGKKKINPASENITNRVDQNGYMSILSHEIRTPLATICSSADLIQRFNKKDVSKNETSSDPRIKEHAVKIRESAYRVIELLDTIIALNKLETGNYSCSSDNIEIIPFFNNLIEKVEMDYAQIPEIKTEFKLEESCCLADKKLLDLIFSNLISNAIKFSRNNDIVNINVKLIDSVIKFEIIDRGIGIPKSDKSKLFDPFFRGSNAGETSGNGLGMFIIKKTVKLLKGKISFRSKIMVGSKFRVEIPVKLK